MWYTNAMKTPMIALVGRPNVGKSTFFNAMVGKNLSIVDATPGVTRDRLIHDFTWQGRNMSLVDTGGLDFDDKNGWNKHIREQVDIAIDLADAVIFLVDGAHGVHPQDEDIAKLLRRSKKPIILAVNKLDNKEREQATLYDFFQLDVGQPFPISCTQRRGLGDLLDEIVDKLGVVATDVDEVEAPKRIALVGRPNAGKSSILNRLVGEKRVMVSEVAGTTRDIVDTKMRFEGKDFILTDTAGIRRKRSIETQTVEHYSVLRALSTIRNSDVVVLVVDAIEGLTEQDVRLAGYADREGKPSIICINKWDLVEKDTFTMNEFRRKLAIDLAFMPYFKPIFISALSGQRIGEIMKGVEFVLERTETRITTGTLNTLIGDAVAITPPPMHMGKRPSFKYATQVSSSPPTFALFVSDKMALKSSYVRYLENTLRKSVDFTGTPIKILLRDNKEK